MALRSLISALAVSLGLSAVGLGASVPTSKRATVCNGHPELCNRSLGNVTFFGSHDSYAFSEDPFALARDQEVDIPTQLSMGVRLLQAQAHENDGVLHFCHTSCALFDGGTVQDYLTKVHTFLQANPNEVMVFVFTNPENNDLKTFWDAPFQASGIASMAYIPPHLPMKRSEWPTLGQLIDSGKRVVVFMDANANPSVVPYILPEFDMIWETPFDSTDKTFPCSVDRIGGTLSTTDHMYMINHFLDVNVFGTGVLISDPADAPTTNGVNSIMANAAGCEPLGGGLAPNFVLLDYVNLGQGMQAVNRLNGLS